MPHMFFFHVACFKSSLILFGYPSALLGTRLLLSMGMSSAKALWNMDEMEKHQHRYRSVKAIGEGELWIFDFIFSDSGGVEVSCMHH